VRAEPAPRYAVISADEGEPGTFKDRFYLERKPHRCLEGALVGAWAVEAEALYLYLRDEYPGLHRVLTEAIAELEAAGLVAPGFVVLRRGAYFDFDDPMGESTCVACGECVQACPTGALMPATLIDEAGRGDSAVADRRVDSICPYCGVGCQLTYHV